MRIINLARRVGERQKGGGREKSRPIIIRARNIVNQRLEKRESDDFYRDLVKASVAVTTFKDVDTASRDVSDARPFA